MSKIKTHPSVCAIVTVYKNTDNQELDRCLSSIRLQRDPYDEIIIIVDGEVSDNLIRSLKEFKSLDEKNNKIIWLQSNLGPGVARNIGIRESKAEYISICDSDDEYSINRNRLTKKIIMENRNVSVIGFYLREIVDGRYILKSVPLNDTDIKNGLRKSSTVNNTTVTIKKDSFIEANGYPDLRYGEDYILWLRMAKLGATFLNIPIPVAKVNLDLNRRASNLDLLKKQLRFICVLNKEFNYINYYCYLRWFFYTILYFSPKYLVKIQFIFNRRMQ
jgi:glycosyltransferase involved in cell wall biosynthesis